MTTEIVPIKVAFVFYAFGISTTLPWNFFITANELWQYKLRNTTISEWPPPPLTPLTDLQISFTPLLVIISNATCFLFLFVTALIVRSVSEKIRIVTSLGLTLFAMLLVTALTVLDSDNWQYGFYSSILSLVALINLGAAVLQSSTIGLAGQMSPSCMVALFSGVSVAGVISSVAYILSLALGGEDKPTISGTIYFVIADVSLFLTICLYFYLTSTNYYKNNIVQNDYCQEYEDFPEDKNGFLKQNVKRKIHESLQHYLNVTKKIWWMAFYNGYTLMITMSVYPAVMVYISSTSEKSVWTTVYFQPTITFLLFNLADMAGREVTRWIQWPNATSWLFHVSCLSRIIFIPLILLCYGEGKQFLTLFYNDGYFVLINILFGLSNGYFCSLTMIYYPKMVKREEQELAGTILAAIFGLMMTIGASLSPLFVKIWGPLKES